MRPNLFTCSTYGWGFVLPCNAMQGERNPTEVLRQPRSWVVAAMQRACCACCNQIAIAWD